MIRLVALALALCACEMPPPADRTYPAYARIDPPAAPAFVYTPPTEAERAAERIRVAGLRRAERREAYRRAVAQRRADFRRAYALSLILN